MRRLPALTALGAALLAAVAVLVLVPTASAQTTEQKLPYTATASRDPDASPTTVGTKFTVATAGKIVGVEFFRLDNQNKATTVQLWGAGSTALATASGIPLTNGWLRANFATPVSVTPGVTYTASYYAPSGHYSVKSQGWAAGRSSGDLTAPVGAGVYRQGSPAGKPTSVFQNEDYFVTPVFVADPVAPPTTTTPPTSTTAPPTSTTTAPPPPPPGGFPNADNTGVPDGTALTPYTGPCEIHDDNVVIENKTISCSIVTYSPGLIIRKSKITGIVFVNAPTASVRVEDSEIDGGSAQWPTVGDRNFTVLRSDIRGGQHATQCYGSCLIQDSWLHDTWPGGKQLDWHENAFISNGGSNITLQHNTLYCTGGCTADVALIPDDDLSNITIDNNLLVASPDSAYCLYGGGTDGAKPGTATGIKVTNNVWQKGANSKCAAFGPVTYFSTTAVGNVWTNNTWEDGAVLNPVF